MKLILILILSTFAVAKDTVSVDVREVVPVTVTKQSAASSTIKNQSDSRQVQSYNLKAVINEQNVMLQCAPSKTEAACSSLAVGVYSGELSRGRFLVLHFTDPQTGKEKKQAYNINGSW